MSDLRGRSISEPGYSPPDGSGDGGTAGKVSQVADTAKAQGAEVFDSVKEHGGEVAEEAKQQARNLAQEAGSQLTEQAKSQQQRAAGGIRSIGEELRGMAQGSTESGTATELVRQASDKLTDLAGWLENREPGAVLQEVREYARRKPGTFLLGAVALGVVAGRATRNLADPSTARTSSPTTGLLPNYQTPSDARTGLPDTTTSGVYVSASHVQPDEPRPAMSTSGFAGTAGAPR